MNFVQLDLFEENTEKQEEKTEKLLFQENEIVNYRNNVATFLHFYSKNAGHLLFVLTIHMLLC